MSAPLFSRPSHLPQPPPAIPFRPEVLGDGVDVLSEEDAQVFTRPTPDAVLQVIEPRADVVAFPKKGALTYFFKSAQAVNETLIEKSDAFFKGEQETVMARAIGWGLIVEEGDSHRRQQKALSSGLRGQVLAQYSRSIFDVASQFVDQVFAEQPLPLLDWARKFAQTSAERALFGSSPMEHDPRYQEELLVLNDMAMWGVDPDLPGHLSVEKIRRFRDSRDFVLGYVEELAKNWQGASGEFPTVLDMIMAEPDASADSPEGVRAQIALFLQASVETTASLVSWLLLSLSDAPHCWDQVCREAAAYGENLGHREVSALPWHRAVINEALRLYPPAWMFPRIANETVAVSGVSIEAGAHLLVSPWVTHRDRRLFDRAEEFWPERWLDGAWSPTRGSYFPFGLGSRICAGERYARLTATIMLNQLARTSRRPVVQTPKESEILASLISGPTPLATLKLEGAKSQTGVVGLSS